MSVTGRIFNIQKFSINDGPGIRTTVFFKGCPLSCRWCSNPESQNRYASIADAMTDETFCGREVTVEDVMAEVIKDEPFYQQSGGGMTLSGGEVLQQADFAIALMQDAKSRGIHSAVETTGFASPERFDRFLPYPDLFLFDFKHSDPEMHKKYTGVDNAPILRNLRTAVETGKEVVVRIPVIPGFNTGILRAREMAKVLAEIGVKEVNLLPFHQFGEKKYEQLGVEYEYTGVRQLHEASLERYRRTFEDHGLDCSFK